MNTYIKPFNLFTINENTKPSKEELVKSINYFERNNPKDSPEDLSHFDSISQMLEEDCSKFINELKSKGGDLLFRGIMEIPYNNDMGIWVKTPIKNRSPLDTNTLISSAFDDYFKEKVNIPLRSQGVFTTKDPNVAKGYSGFSNTDDQFDRSRKSYIFFPIGDYRYFWNPEIIDLFNDISDEDWYSYLTDKMILDPDLHIEDYISKSEYDIEGEIKEVVDGYKEGGLNEVSIQEVTFILKKYYIIDEKYYYKIKEWLKIK